MFYRFARALLIPIFRILYNYKVTGLENMPKDGAYIVCSNHISAIDPILVGLAIPYRMYFMAKVELFSNRFVSALMRGLGVFPIKRGEPDIKGIKTALKILNNGEILALFPEGTRNRTGDIMAEPGIAMIAIRSKVPVVPVAIISSYKFFKKTDIVVGKPIELIEHYGKKLLNEEYIKISYGIMGKIYDLNVLH